MVVDLCALFALVVTIAVWGLDPLRIGRGPHRLEIDWKAWLLVIPVALFLARVPFAAALRRRGAQPAGLWPSIRYRQVLLALAVPFAVFLAAESLLAALGVHAELPPLLVRGADAGTDEGSDVAMVPDARLLWRFQPGAEFRGRRVNQLGFLGRDVETNKPVGTVRVICLGDSCSAIGGPPYAGLLHNRLQREPPTPAAWEAFNMAVHGYSVAQGLRLFQERVRVLQPDVVTVYYGWNDHWLGPQDSSRMAVERAGASAAAFNILRNKRIFHLLLYRLGSARRIARNTAGAHYRVPPPEYRWMLEQLVAHIREADAIPVLVTAPRAEHLAAQLVHNGQARSTEEAERAHDEYVELTRETARATDAALLDLAAQWKGEGSDGLFMADGIHPVAEGLQRVADGLYTTLCEVVRSPAWPPANQRRTELERP